MSTQPRIKPSRRRLAALATVAALAVAGLQAVAAEPAAAALGGHAYSDPIWFPVHDANTRLGCVGNLTGNNNGDTAPGQPCDSDHNGYWAMNITSLGGVDDNPAIYAAGAGVVESVTSPQEPACGGPHGDGNTVVIEHGGGVVSVYEHLRSITVTQGQQVYPSTQIGVMGASGQSCDANGGPKNAYLNFQVRVMGGGYLKATTTQVRALRGCVGSDTGSTVWPAGLGLGVRYWSDVAYGTQLPTAGQGRCYPSAPVATPAQQRRPTLTPGNARVRVSWPAVTGATRYMVQTQIYRKGTGFEAPCSPYSDTHCTVGYTGAAGTRTHVAVTRLTNAREYRMRYAVHNKWGWSLWSRWVLVTPTAPPDAPTFHRITSSRHAVALSWHMPKSDLNGATLTGFQVGIDYLRNGSWTKFRFDTIGDTTHYLWTGLRRHTTYRVLVRAVTKSGVGYWMHAHRIRTT